EWFRLHPLFREMLQAELTRLRPELKEVLLARASDWYLEERDVGAAIECAIAAGDRGRVAALCGNALFPAYRAGRFVTVERWLATVDDPKLLAAHTAVASLGAILFALEGRAPVAERWARCALEADPDELMPDGSRAEAWLAEMRGVLCLDGPAAMAEQAELAVSTLAAGSPLEPSAQLLLSFAYLLNDDAERAIDAFGRTIEVATEHDSSIGSSTSLAALALLAAGRGELRDADALARRAREVVASNQLDSYLTSAYVYAACASVALVHGRRATARNDLER